MDTEILRGLIDYNPSTGVLTRKVDLAANAKAGAPLICKNAAGYIQAVIKREFFYGHRLAWQIFYGDEPLGPIDHINGNTSDNRIANLRMASNAENLRNTKLRKDNSSGVKGVSWMASYGKWVAKLNSNNKLVYEEYFDSLEEAAHAIRAQRLRHHAHFTNHG